MDNKIVLRDVVVEDFCNYKLPSMFLISSYCDWKCCREANIDESVCQNHGLISGSVKQIPYKSLYQAYIDNNITKAIIIGGLEPFLQFEEILGLISYFREKGCMDVFVIYTGYYFSEIPEQIEKLRKMPNIIVKYGRYIPDKSSRYDEVLGITLASNNQYAEKIS